MQTVKIKIVSNDGEEAVGIDQDLEKEVAFTRKDLAANRSDFRTDLATGSIS